MKRLKIILFFISLNLLPQIVICQQVHVELGGAAGAYSVNYDTRFSLNSKLGFRVGLSVLPSDGVFLLVPLQLNYVSGREHGIEFGAGLTAINSIGQLLNGQQFSGHDDAGVYPNITLAYRFKTTKSLKFRAGFTSLIGADFAPPLNFFWPTLSIGHQF